MNLKKIKDKMYYLFLVILSTIYFFGFVNKDLPNLDSATFLYVARIILEGAVPYKDVFDHKPPLIYFIDVLGFLISQKSLWGLWALELIFLYISVITSFNIFKNFFGKLPSLVGVSVWLGNFAYLLDGGNLTEEYALAFQFIYLYIFLKINTKKYLKMEFILGSILGLLFMLKQNLIAIPLACFLYQIFQTFNSHNWRIFLQKTITQGIGFLSVLLIFFIFFNLKNALFDFYQYAFLFNKYYSGQPFANIANVIYSGILNTLNLGLIILALVGWFDILVYFLYSIKRNYLKNQKPLLIILLFALPLEFLLVSISGKIYKHYYLSWIPVTSSLTAYLIFLLFHKINPISFKNKLLYLLRFSIVFIIILNTLFILNLSVTNLIEFREDKNPTIEFIKANTTKSDYVLVWGMGSTINFATDRKSPTKFLYQTPLYTPGFSTDELNTSFLQEIKSNKPKYILDGNTLSDKFQPINCQYNFKDYQYRLNFKPLPSIMETIDYICHNYFHLTNTGGYKIYQINE